MKVVVYTANADAHRVPVTPRLPLARLRSGLHTLKAKISYRETVTNYHHHRTVTVTKTLTVKFRVC